MFSGHVCKCNPELNFADEVQSVKTAKFYTPQKFVPSQYNHVIQDHLDKGIVEAVPADKTGPRTTHYLPHHAVTCQDKSTTRISVVYDISANGAKRPSLKDFIQKGFKFNQLLFDLLVQFRSCKFSLKVDLRKAFLMVAVGKADQDVLQFIWVDDPFVELPSLKLINSHMSFFGVSSSPFLLNATIRFHLEKHLGRNERLVKQLLILARSD